MIGIRQADGSFYEIMGDVQAGRKRLVLSAARTDQHGVRIELFRSEDGTIEDANALGSIALDDPEGLGYKDIEFRVDLDSEGQLEASAALPGQPPRKLSVDLSPFRRSRTDSDILADDSLSTHELDTLDDQFSLDPEPMTLDLPEVGELSDLDEPKLRTDADILGDDALASAELDTLDDFSFEPEAEPEVEPTVSFEDEAEPEATPGDPLDDLPPLSSESFDLGELDAGFGEEEPEAPVAPPAAKADEPGEEWEKISLDDMESLEFMDTGDEISAPKSKPAPEVASRAPAADHDDFSFDDRQPLELSDLDSDLSELPDLEDKPTESLDDLDQDFLAPPALTETPDWDVDEEVAPTPAKPTKAPKPPKAPKEARASRPARSREGSPGALDKTALFLSLATLSLLVLLILVLLFLNMIKPPQPPVVQPEVMRWKPVATLMMPAGAAQVADIDLGSSSAPTFEGSSVLDLPEGLRGARISLRLQSGETPADAQRRFGTPARSQGNLLLW